MPAGETAYGRIWATYICNSCGDVVLAKGEHARHGPSAEIEAIFPTMPTVSEEVPETARRYLEQAYESLHAPDAAAVMSGSAVDAMLKEKNYHDGSLYTRIDQAVRDHVLTEEMGEWAHEVRLGSNRPRHADADRPHVTEEEAKQSVEFADALAQFLFVLPARIKKGLEAVPGSEDGEAS